MIIDPVKTELAIRQDLDEMRALRRKRLDMQDQIDHQIAALNQQRAANAVEIERLDKAITKWESQLAPDPISTPVVS
jgi:hypothetical protein